MKANVTNTILVSVGGAVAIQTMPFFQDPYYLENTCIQCNPVEYVFEITFACDTVWKVIVIFLPLFTLTELLRDVKSCC